MLEVLLAAGYGLESAHRSGFVHRDFKPDNVLLGHDGRVCVADFGLVRRRSKSAKSPGEIPKEILGTPSYMSPEQHQGELATALSDQFSFCVSLFEVAYGVRPFLGRNLGEIAAAVEGGQMTVPVDGHKVPRWLHQIMMRGLSVDPADRYPSMQELLTDLAFDRRRKSRQWTVGGVAVLLLIGSIGFSEFSAVFKPDTCRLIDSRISHAQAHLQRAGDPPIVRASYLGNSGSAFGSLLRYNESKAAFREAIAISEQFRGPGHPGTLVLLNNLALTLQHLGRNNEAISYFRKSIEVGKRSHGPAHPSLILPLSNLSLLLWRQGKITEALDSIRQAIKVSDLAIGPEARESAREYHRYRQMLLNAGKYKQAIKFWRENEALFDWKRRNSSVLFQAQSELSDVLLSLGRIEKADKAMQKVDISRRGPDDGQNWERIFPQAIQFYLRRGEVEKAEHVYATMMGFGLDFLHEDLDTIGKVAMVRGDLDLAKEQARAALKMHEVAYLRARNSYPGEDNVHLVPYEVALARSSEAAGDVVAAIKWMQQAIDHLHRGLSDSPHLLSGQTHQKTRNIKDFDNRLAIVRDE